MPLVFIFALSISFATDAVAGDQACSDGCVLSEIEGVAGFQQQDVVVRTADELTVRDRAVVLVKSFA